MPVGHLPRGGAALADAVRELYRQGQTDYSLEPIVLVNARGRLVGRIEDGDAVIFCCRRGEREIQLTEAFVEPGLDRFPRRDFEDLTFVILTLYHEKFKDLPVAFAPAKIKDTLGEIVSRAALRQLRVAESEKFAHVTFFLSGGNHQPFPGEDDVRIPSPQGVPFEQVPGLSLAQVTQEVLQGIERQYDLIVTNFANGDVIGHTQNRDAKIACAGLVDAHLGRVVKAALAADYVVLVTADHGTLEEMTNADGTPHVAHTANPVPFILIDPRAKSFATLREGRLADIAPTVLRALHIAPPDAMTGETLAPGYDWGERRRVLLVILDGWGIGRDDAANPIFLAHTPVRDDLRRSYPCTRLQAAGEAVGLKPGKAGNSEAGHMNIGAGRIVLQDDVRLDLAMKDGSFYTNEIFRRVMDEVKRRNTRLHLIGLLTEKSSHGSIDYPLALLRMAKTDGLSQVYLHVIFDGRSTEPGSAPAMLEKLESQVEEIGIGRIVSGVGRGIALDRDGNYAKTKRAYDALVFGVGKKCTSNRRRQREMDLRFLQDLVVPTQTKIAMIIMDGLGGLPLEPGGKTELETAHTPNLDVLAAQSTLGLTVPVRPGITPGSGPGHLGIFGYDPIQYEIGRGALEALGVDFELGPDDVAARGNFCSLDGAGLLTDRRAGRISTDVGRGLAKLLRTVAIDGVEFFIEPVKEHRFAFVMRGSGLGDALTETDPHKTGVPPMPVCALKPDSEKAAQLVNQFVEQAHKLLADKHPANMILLRGFAKFPAVPTYPDLFGLRAAAIAVNGMYRGVAKLVGMTVLKVDGDTLMDEFATLERNWNDYDFFYLHVKKTDTAGEDGDFLRKVHVIEEVDALMPRLLALKPDVVIVSGDHSSPALLKSHSWHPVPTLLYSQYVRADGIAEFGERACARGSLGVLPAKDVMPIALANAQRIAKFGA
jgi:2,3-bisphosphoglycerate-independent phosphoglycerate mutase